MWWPCDSHVLSMCYPCDSHVIPKTYLHQDSSCSLAAAWYNRLYSSSVPTPASSHLWANQPRLQSRNDVSADASHHWLRTTAMAEMSCGWSLRMMCSLSVLLIRVTEVWYPRWWLYWCPVQIGGTIRRERCFIKNEALWQESESPCNHSPTFIHLFWVRVRLSVAWRADYLYFTVQAGLWFHRTIPPTTASNVIFVTLFCLCVWDLSNFAMYQWILSLYFVPYQIGSVRCAWRTLELTNTCMHGGTNCSCG